jgi:hypothetical protein
MAEQSTSHIGPQFVRPGDLALSWRIMLGLAWLVAFFAYAAIWQASVQIGISTWWIGPRAQPTNVAIRLIPFVLVLVVALCVIYNTAKLLRSSFIGVLLCAAIALPDFSRSTGLAVAELVIPVMLGLVTAAAMSGRYQLASASLGVWPPPEQ